MSRTLRVGRHAGVLLAALLMVVLALVGIAAPARAAIHTIDCGAVSYSPGDLQALVDAAAPGDRIDISASTCHENLYIAKRLILKGTVAGEVRTVIDGSGAVEGPEGRLAATGYAVVTVDNARVDLIDLVITGGGSGAATAPQQRDVGPASNGSGISNWGGTVIVRRSIVTGNSSSVGGGGVYNTNGGLVRMFDSLVTLNEAFGHGGGVYNGGLALPATGQLELVRTAIENNLAFQSGGGVYNGPGSTFTALDSAVNDNQAGSTPDSVPGDGGGGVYNWAGTVTLTGTQVVGNIAGGGGIFAPETRNGGYPAGGGIYNYNGLFTLQGGSAVHSNTVFGPGGGVYNVSGEDAGPSSVFTATDSAIGPDNWAYEGGGVYNGYGASFNASNTVIDDNDAVPIDGVEGDIYEGGGIYNDNGAVTLVGGSLSGNEAYRGGGFYNRDDFGCCFGPETRTLTAPMFLHAEGTVITNNRAWNPLSGVGSAYHGGGGYNVGGEVHLDAVDLSANHAADHGGALYNSSPANVTVSSSLVSGNTSDGSGGAFYNRSPGGLVLGPETRGHLPGALEIIDTLVEGNVTLGNGGGVYNVEPAQVWIEGSTLSSNSAWDGGGIYNDVELFNETVHVFNSTVSGNVALNYGGGAYNAGGTLEFSFATVTGNAAVVGGGVYSAGGGIPGAPLSRAGHLASGAANLEATILYGNSASVAGDDCALGNGGGPGGSAFSHGYNVLGAGVPGDCGLFHPDDVAGVDPLLGPLADNGGPTPTHRPDGGSVAVDLVPYGPTEDQRDVGRPQLNDFDSGAVEILPDCNGLAPTILGTEGRDVIDGTPGDDVIVTFGGPDLVRGLGGNDTICTGDGNDEVYGGPGNDSIFTEGGDDRAFGESGDDLLDGGDGTDRLEGGDGMDTLLGGAARDILRGGNDADVIEGGGGNDVIAAGNGDDTADGGTGNDRVDGQGGNDILRGSSGNDTVIGAAGNDFLSGGDGFDVLRGGAGTDTCTEGEDVTGCEL